MAKQFKPDTIAEAERILNDLKAKRYKPIYLLCGEEPYYIDLIADYIEDNVLNDDEKEFNLSILFGADTNINNVLMTARQYPLMAEHQVIIVKEAQSMGKLDALQKYLKQPTLSSIIVLCYKHGKPDGRQKAVQLIPSVGELFETSKIEESRLSRWVESYVKQTGLTIQEDAVELLVEFVGNDLTAIVHNIDKLKIILAAQNKTDIDVKIVADYTGKSRENHNFELKSALACHDILKTNKIVEHFAKNPKANSVIPTISTLFYFFSNLLAYETMQDRDSYAVARKLMMSVKGVSELSQAARFYPVGKTMRIISYLRQADAQSKGFGVPTDITDHDILRELVFKILH
ncbi:MAG: DNA polymerase III subunit delta [Bacteroidales bacterium]|nr:DNA polymerase III subunit delta [Bacteroidales bacterium]